MYHSFVVFHHFFLCANRVDENFVMKRFTTEKIKENLCRRVLNQSPLQNDPSLSSRTHSPVDSLNLGVITSNDNSLSNANFHPRPFSTFIVDRG